MEYKNSQNTELANIFLSFINSCFNTRSLDEIFSYLHQDITIFSVLKDKELYGKDAIMHVLNIFKNFTNPIEYEIETYSIRPINDECFYVTSSLKIDKEHILLTLIFVKSDDRWQITHIHESKDSAFIDIETKSSIYHLFDRSRQLEEMVKDRTKALQDVLKKMEYAATHDSLTGLYNRFRFNEVLLEEIQKAKANNQPFCIILGDIDYFKQVNDRLGHLHGDKALVVVSDILKANTRKHDIITRWGGEEFIILSSNTTLVDAMNIAENLRKIIEHNTIIPLTISFGISEFSYDDTIDTLLNKVDLALYKAKRKGRNRIEI
jgi:diguanylate cyclase (GGDEF)-like protein